MSFSLRRTSAPRGRSARGHRGARLVLEALETREVPAALMVTVGTDDGAGSLRDQLAVANTNNEDDTITFDPGVTAVSLTSAGLVLSEANQNLVIDGGQAGVMVMRDAAAPAFRILDVMDGVNATLMNVSLGGGMVTGEGGGIRNAGNLMLSQLTVTGNTTMADPLDPLVQATGGGIANLAAGILVVSSVLVDGNTGGGSGGGLSNAGTLTIENTSVSNNMAAFNGGGVSSGGMLRVFNSVLLNNTAGSGGGGIESSGTLALINSTLAGNRSTEGGAAVLNSGTATLRNDTVTNNRSGGAASDGAISTSPFGVNSSLLIHNSIVAGNFTGMGTTPSDLDPTVGVINPGAASSNNIIGDAGSAGGLTAGINGNLVGFQDVNLILGPLTNLGQTTIDHFPLAAGSPAIDAGNNAEAVDDNAQPLPFDLIGLPRVVNNTVDIGAVESQTVTPTATFAVAARTEDEGFAQVISVTVNLSSPAPQDLFIQVGFTGTAVVTDPLAIPPAPPSDYSVNGFAIPPFTVQIPTGMNSGTIELMLVDDTDQEPDEDAIITLQDSPGVTIGAANTFTLTITDNDAVASTIELGSANFTGTEGANGVVTITRTGTAAGETVTLTLTPVTGPAAGSANDVNSLTATVTFGAGETTATVVNLTNDTTVEGTERFTLALSNPTGGATLGAQATGTLTITDDDGTANQRYANALYRQMLNRQIDPAGLTFWTTFLNNATTQLEGRFFMSFQLATSDEFRARIVTDLYQQYFNRAPDAAGLNSALAFLRSQTPIVGNRAFDMLKAIYLSSTEFFQVQGGTAAGYLNGLFMQTLGRPFTGPVPTGLDVSSTTARQNLALSILQSREADEFVTRDYYRRVLNVTQPDQAGLTFWTGLYVGINADGTARGFASEDQVISGIAAFLDPAAGV